MCVHERMALHRMMLGVGECGDERRRAEERAKQNTGHELEVHNKDL